MQKNSYFFNRRLFIILILGFSSGLPLALTSSTLQAWYTVSGINIITIGLLGLVGQPYVFKFIWAPLMDRFDIPWLGRRRGWMLIAQILLLVSIISMSLFNPALHPVLLGAMGLLVAFLSASQDITINAYSTDILLPEERGMGSAMTVAGYRIAMVVSGGGALIMAAEIGWHWTYVIMGFMMCIGMLATLAAPKPVGPTALPETLSKAIVNPLKDLVYRQSGLIVLLFIFLYKLSYEFVLAMTPIFLLRNLGFTLIQVGAINKGVGFIALFIGIFIGGAALTRLNILRALLIFGSLQACGTLGYVYLAIIGHNLHALILVISADNFFVGLESAAFVAFLMGLCNHRYTAMQFALLSAIATVGRIFAGPIGALIVDYSNWVYFYLMSFLIAIPALILLWRQQHNFSVANDCQTQGSTVELKI